MKRYLFNEEWMKTILIKKEVRRLIPVTDSVNLGGSIDVLKEPSQSKNLNTKQVNIINIKYYNNL